MGRPWEPYLGRGGRGGARHWQPIGTHGPPWDPIGNHGGPMVKPLGNPWCTMERRSGTMRGNYMALVQHPPTYLNKFPTNCTADVTCIMREYRPIAYTHETQKKTIGTNWGHRARYGTRIVQMRRTAYLYVCVGGGGSEGRFFFGFHSRSALSQGNPHRRKPNKPHTKGHSGTPKPSKE